MSLNNTQPKTALASGGFSLLEMMVAIAILALALGSLYQAVSGATRNVRSAEKYAYAVEMAQSLLADNAQVSHSEAARQGETPGGFVWEVATSALNEAGSKLARSTLRTIEVSVSWQDGEKRRNVILNSVVEALPR